MSAPSPEFLPSLLAGDINRGPKNRPAEFPLRYQLYRWFGRQTSLIPRGRDTILRFFCDPERCEPYPFEVDFFGARYQGNISSFIDWNVFMYGSYAFPELSLLTEITQEVQRRRQSANFFDVGANIGHHTLFMARLADHIFAFEPFSGVRTQIEAKVALNRLDNVRIVPVALGCADEEMEFFPSAGRNGGRGTLIGDHGEDFDEPVTVPVRNGDRLFDDLGLPRVDILKIDVEGFEPFVLRGLSQRIQADRPVVLTELSDQSRTNLSSENEFRSLFYEDALFAQVCGRQGCRFQLHPFEYSGAHEVLIVPPEWSEFIKPRFHL